MAAHEGKTISESMHAFIDGLEAKLRESPDPNIFAAQRWIWRLMANETKGMETPQSVAAYLGSLTTRPEVAEAYSRIQAAENAKYNVPNAVGDETDISRMMPLAGVTLLSSAVGEEFANEVRVNCPEYYDPVKESQAE